MSSVQLEKTLGQEIYEFCLDSHRIVDLDMFKRECGGYGGSLDMLLEEYNAGIVKARGVLEDSPIDVEGEWKSYRELREIANSLETGYGLSGLEMGEILDYGYKPFKKREKEGIVEYWVDYGPCSDDSAKYGSCFCSFVPNDKFDIWKGAFNDLNNYSGMVGVLGGMKGDGGMSVESDF
ncbi:hypothetical protein HOE04_03255 [archaeon]|jgi:hypothetical protein|nr:hypothetical protein [archaeon]